MEQRMEHTQLMELFRDSCRNAADYPKNLVYHGAYKHSLISYCTRLDEQESRLFFDETKAAVDFWEYDGHAQNQNFWHSCIKGVDGLDKHLGIALLPSQCDPRCRFIFVHAPHSRERLKTTRQMLMLILSYHQVLPSFLDHLFPFGRQQYAQDFYFNAFRHESRLGATERGLYIQSLGRSGRDIRLCYSLKSVEPSKRQQTWPWSIRQTAIYHSFDVETGSALWLMGKGDQLMKNRMMTETSTSSQSDPSPFCSNGRAFASTLSTHLILCDWAAENWRWYINFLEEELQKTTRDTLTVTIHKPSSPISEGSIPQSNGIHMQEDFCFTDLQRINFIQEKVNEVSLVLKTNAEVIAELKKHYGSIAESEDFPRLLKQDCRRDLARFENRVASVERDLWLQQSIVKSLLRLLADRKSLLYGIINYRNMEASKMLAAKSQLSAVSMEEIARKTKQETVSMRIITLVTLFFLPGTFISTFMSTDIVRFQTEATRKTEKTVSMEALQLYAEISLPLTLMTFAAWYGVYWWVNRKEQRRLNMPVFKSEV